MSVPLIGSLIGLAAAPLGADPVESALASGPASGLLPQWASQAPRRAPRPGGPQQPGDAWTDEDFERAAAEVATQVVEIVGMEFLAPVPLELLEQTAFVDRVRAWQEANRSRQDLERTSVVAKLFGMLPGDLDLTALLDEIRQDARGGFFDSGSGHLVMVREIAQPYTRAVMARELARALAEQRYGERRDGESGFGEPRSGEGAFDDPRVGSPGGFDSDRDFARRAVIVGFSLSVLERWRREYHPPLTPLDVRRIDSIWSNSTYGEAPPYIWRSNEGLGRRGESFLRRTSALTTNASDAHPDDIARALSDPPRSTEQLLHPVKYWKRPRIDEPRRLEWQLDSVPPGWDVVRRDTCGEFYLGIMTLPPEERTTRAETSLLDLISARYTTDAADGWDGDRYILLEKGETRVLQLVSVWDSPEEAAEFHAALVALEELIESEKALAPGFDTELSGFRSHYDGGDRVTVTSWTGAQPGSIGELQQSLRCVEVEG